MRWFDKLGVKIMCDAQEPNKTLKPVHILGGPSIIPPMPLRPKTTTETFLTHLLALHNEKQIEYQSSTDKDGFLSIVFKRIKE